MVSLVLALEENVPLAPLCTLEVGGPARYLARCRDRDELGRALRRARDEGLEVFLLGGGSNLLVADAGFDGLVVLLEDEALEISHRDAHTARVRAGAGLKWDRLVAATVDAGLGGLECLSGIPGRVGAAPIQNVGAYGQEVAETVARVEAVEIASGRELVFAAAECGFAYRDSHFKSAWRGRYALVGVEFHLPYTSRGTVRYRDLEHRFGKGAAPPLAEVRQAVLEIRRGKSMVLDRADPNHRSAGSFFTNPIVTPALAEEVRRRLGAKSQAMPAWPVDEGRVKLSAAWLIERAGFERGFRLGRAAVSSRHSLALVNAGGATAAEILELARTIRAGVYEACGIELELEPTLIGFDAAALVPAPRATPG